MTKNTYYKFLHKHHLQPAASKLSPNGNVITTYVDDIDVREGIVYLNNVACYNVRVVPRPQATSYNCILEFGEAMNKSIYPKGLISQRHHPIKTVTGRVIDVHGWITQLIMDDKVIPFDDFDVDPARKQKIVLGAAIKYATHSMPLEDIFWNMATENKIIIMNGALVSPPPSGTAPMSKEEVAAFLDVHRSGERADWWFLYQILIKHEHLDILSKTPYRTLAVFKKEGILLTIPVAYPTATVAVRKPGSRIWDPF